ncbi:MAG: hypothetical protein MJ001_04830 [Paludibacteraceae bacterium]|nr:hypothetical protein [Paludibacteraceae bacterium]
MEILVVAKVLLFSDSAKYSENYLSTYFDVGFRGIFSMVVLDFPVILRRCAFENIEGGWHVLAG